MVVVVPAAAAATQVMYRWKDPRGVVRNLGGEGSSVPVRIMVGEKGLGIPDFDLTEDKLPSSPGSVIRHANTKSREIDLPIVVGPVASPAALDGLMDALYDWFATADETSLTPGYFQCHRSNDTWREIACYYVTGLGGDLGLSVSTKVMRKARLVLKAASTWTQDIEDTVQTYHQADLSTPLAVINSGQLTAYPIWTITGPCSALVMTNVSTGEVINLTEDGGLALTAGQQLTIDTREPNERSGYQVVLGDGTNEFTHLTAGTSIWHLGRGQTNFTLAAAGASANTSVELRYRTRYRGMR